MGSRPRSGPYREYAVGVARWSCGLRTAVMRDRPFPFRDRDATMARVSRKPQRRAAGEKGTTMGQPVVHFEVIGKDAEKLQRYYSELFGWEIDADNPLNYG